MSVLIKDMEKPKSCFEIIDGDFEYCPFVNTDDDCVLLLKKGICNATWKEQYSKCPLAEVLEPCEDAVSRKTAIEAVMDLCKHYTPTKSVNHPHVDFVIEVLQDLPSAQPEVIRCKDCEYGEQDDVGRWFCNDLGCQMGNEDGSGYCANAERRTDELGDS